MRQAASKRRPRDPWLTVRRELSANRRLVLMALSFLLPVGLWCALTYIPLFHSDMKFTLTVEKIGGMAAFTPGDRVKKPYFGEYTDRIRQENRAVLADRAAGAEVRSSRTNKKRMRQIRPVAQANGWLAGVDTDDTTAVDAALFDVTGGLAEGRLTATALPLTDENLAILRDNWAILQAHTPYDPASFPKTPLQYLIPQGVSGSPVYLPAPHECIQAAWRDFTTEPDNNLPWMYERLISSLKVVFGAFLLACAIGVPLGLLCGTYDLAAKIVEPFTDFFRYMPAPTFGLLLQAAFGIYGAPKIALVFIGTFPHMVLMLGNTTRLLDRSLLEAAQTLGAKNKALVARVIIPGILPKMYNDLRVLLGWAWTWLVIAELIGEKSGLTDFIVTQGGKYNFDRVFPVIMMIGVIGFVTDQVLQVLAKRLFPWEYTRSGRGFFASLGEALARPFRRSTAPASTRPEPTGAADVPAA